MPEMANAAARRTAESQRLDTGTREMSSTVTSRARGGQAAKLGLIGLCRACSTLAATEAATPRARVARTPQRTRVRFMVVLRSWLGAGRPEPVGVRGGGRVVSSGADLDGCGVVG